MEEIDLSSINCVFANDEYMLENLFINQNILVPGNTSFFVILDANSRFDTEYKLSFNSTNNIGIKYIHTFEIKPASIYTRYSKETV